MLYRGFPLLNPNQKVRVWYDSTGIPDELAARGAVGIRLYVPSDDLILSLERLFAAEELTVELYGCEMRLWVDPKTDFLYRSTIDIVLEGTAAAAEVPGSSATGEGVRTNHRFIQYHAAASTDVVPATDPLPPSLLPAGLE